MTGDPITIKALLDSGSDASFIDEKLARELELPVDPTPVSLSATWVNDDHAVPLHSDKITSLISTTVDTHQEQWQFYLINCPKSPVILGLDWLRQSNPLIDWSTGVVTFPKDSSTHVLLSKGPPDTASVACVTPYPAEIPITAVHISAGTTAFSISDTRQLVPMIGQLTEVRDVCNSI